MTSRLDILVDLDGNNLVAIGLLLPAERSGELDEKLKKYNAQKDELTAKAEARDAASGQGLARSRGA